jgi:hypothetical protein
MELMVLWITFPQDPESTVEMMELSFFHDR